MDEPQRELPLPFPELSGDLPLLPARMVNEYQYCPRLAYLEWVQGEWSESSDTVEGRHAHRRVDKPGGDLPNPADVEAGERVHARSITLSSNRLGLIARMDLVEGDGNVVTPVDYKRGKRPHVAQGAYDPERVQLCVQGLILEEHGYQCDEGMLYFAESRERVRVAFCEELRALTRNAIDGLRLIAAGGRIPPPLQDSPKCPRCSLVGICLPDEVNFLKKEDTAPRPLAVARSEALPVYVQARGAKVAKKGEVLEISVEDKAMQTARLIDVSQLVLMGNIYVTTPTLHELMARGIPISWHSFGGWFLGHSFGTGHKNVEIRTAQYRASFDDSVCLRIAKGLVMAKIQNQRTLLRRNWKREEGAEHVMDGFPHDLRRAQRAANLPELLGAEGQAAARYFGHFSAMLSRHDNVSMRFDFTTRNRRPPTDPVNALLSYAYALLVRAWTMVLTAVGFDAYRGFYHQPRYGRPALALDIMEPFRPLIADSSVIQAINNGEVRPTDFISAAGSVALTEDGRKRFIGTFERRMSQEVTHPLFGYKLSYRRLLELQSRLLARHLLGEIAEYPNFTTR
ncbi:CRISPR-associated endonuclease Cas4/Cas1 [Nitrosovibrio sp. Nv17]|uniref:CRISPR-associated endonuclease Cas4/Cas1 n=1 Tax=Nitrosovibrio sp. Nv17 TaxID=1855339 RepID=UPI0009091784|nr:CRISPR-associated endonuclease Cas4/Cas1 [Nitrosovibrio sp. Nv17]SFW35561.1 CRISPR-associated exonuclease Cas4/CRISP-associated protein Cas1 [Nitrosovibrio sp. Nv17]